MNQLPDNSCSSCKQSQTDSSQKKNNRSGYLLMEQADKLEVVVTFLAVLELMKIGKIHLMQEEIFGDMQIETLEPEGEEADLDLEGLDDFAE